MSYTRFFCHLILRTKAGRRTLDLEHSEILYAYPAAVAKEKGAFVHLINGMEEHVHPGIVNCRRPWLFPISSAISSLQAAWG